MVIFVVLVALKASVAFRLFFAYVVGDVGDLALVVLDVSGADRIIVDIGGLAHEVLVALEVSGADRRIFADVGGDVGGKAHVVALEVSGADRVIFADVGGDVD